MGARLGRGASFPFLGSPPSGEHPGSSQEEEGPWGSEPLLGERH